MLVAPAPIAYLTCELKGRDFASRLLIASHILRAGYPVIVGQQWSMWRNIPTAPKGCFLYKSTNMTQGEGMRRCREAGHVVLAADEEVLASSREDITRSTHPDAIRYCDHFLALSKPHREALIEAFPDVAPKISVAGTARVDILRASNPPPPREGSYILFNTSFGIINSIWGDAQAAAAAWIEAGGHQHEPAEQTIAMVRDRIAFEQMSLDETHKLIRWVLANTKLDVVLRPHPQERPDMWAKIHERVRVVTGSDPMSWMRYAVVTVHSESTTGVEAAIMGAKALNLSPPQAWSSRLIVSEVNPTVTTAAQGAELILALLGTGAWPSAKSDPLDMFPSGGAQKTAEAILATLPPRGSLGSMKWIRKEPTDIQKKKFTASLDEIHAALPCRAMELDASIFYLESPRAAP